MLGHLLQLQHRRPTRPLPADQGRPRGGHVAGTTMRCPGASAPVTCTSPEVSSKIPGLTGTQRRVFPGPTTSTTYPPGDRASSAPTGTARTLLTLAVVMLTVTGACSRVPADLGSVSFTCTGIVVVGLPPDPDVVAAVPTEETTPGVVVPSGSVMLTVSPAFTSDCCEASSGIVTTCRSDVAVSTGPDAGPPRLPVTAATRSAAGSNTTCPNDRLPGG